MASLSPASAHSPPLREAMHAVSVFCRNSGFLHHADEPSAPAWAFRGEFRAFSAHVFEHDAASRRRGGKRTVFGNQDGLGEFLPAPRPVFRRRHRRAIPEAEKVKVGGRGGNRSIGHDGGKGKGSKDGGKAACE